MTQPPESPYGDPYPQQPTPQQPPAEQSPVAPPQFGQASPYGQAPPPQYGQQPPPQFGEQPPYGTYPPAPGVTGPKPSPALAIVALILAILGFFVLPIVVSVILAIVVLLRGKGAGGRGLAIAALVVDALWTALIVLVVVIAIVSPSSSKKDDVRGADGRVSTPQDLSVLALREGDCFDDPALYNAATGGAESDTIIDTTSVHVVPCTTPHELEYYATVDVSDEGDSYPGEDVLTQRADTGCGTAFTSFVGKSPAESMYGYTHYIPQSGVWALKSQRKITCVLGDPKDETTGSLAGADK